MYEGKLTRLRRLETKDASFIFPHWNNYELRQYLPTPLPSSQEDLINFIKTVNDDFGKRKGFTFGIEAISNNTLFGLVNLVNISWLSRNSEITLFSIFDPEYLGQGYGFDAILVLLDFAFSILDMHNVYLWVTSYNERAINFYEKIGFRKQGKIREIAFRNGKRYDVVIMDILKPEYLEKHGILPK
ncbi:MAG: GNAT family N-acetyltransferase [Promethearchaeota archaeon]